MKLMPRPMQASGILIFALPLEFDLSKVTTVKPWAAACTSPPIAFTLGTLSRGWLASNADVAVENQQPPVEEPAGPLMATISLKSEFGSQIPATLQIPVVVVQNSGAEPASTPISEYDRQKWERRGYQLTKERRFLPAQLPGGKKVVVPVEQVKANYVGSKVS